MNWVRIFKSREEGEEVVPLNGMRRLRYKDHLFCLLRLEEGFFALKDECPHERVPLSGGWINKKGEVVCSLHHYCFEVRFGEEQTGKPYRVQTFPVEVRLEGVFIGVPDSL